MNERIKTLWEESTLSCWPRPGKFTAGEYDYNLEAYTKAIVKLCADIALEHTPDTEECNYTWLIHDKIKEHFGVTK
jgi:hypothetical protein